MIVNYMDLRENHAIFFLEFNETWILSTDLPHILKYLTS
jgi:hypothetical protein